MVLRLPTLDMRNVLLTIYALVWAVVVVGRFLKTGEVSTEALGALGLGVTAILFAFRDSSKPPTEGP